MEPNIVICVRRERNLADYFPVPVLEAASRLGRVEVLDTEACTPELFAAGIAEADVCMTHWGCPQFTGAMLDRAPRLKLIAHCAGTVAAIASGESYQRGVRVCSANDVMARYVAEGALAYILCGMKRLAQHDSWMKRGELWKQETREVKSLYGGKVGMIGLGAIGRQLLELLRPFAPEVRLYDPYVPPESLAGYSNVTMCSLDEALAFGDAVTIHASLTAQTRGMIGRRELKFLRDGAVLVNTARGAIVDEAALADELATGRISAILDVFEKEPLPLTSPLRALENVTLLPHMAGCPVREQMAMEMTEEIRRFLSGQPLLHEIPYERFLLMTHE